MQNSITMIKYVREEKLIYSIWQGGVSKDTLKKVTPELNIEGQISECQKQWRAAVWCWM